MRLDGFYQYLNEILDSVTEKPFNPGEKTFYLASQDSFVDTMVPKSKVVTLL